MAVIWPPQLPAVPLLDSYEETAPTMVRRSSMDAGPPKVGRRFTANVSTITCRYALTRTQVQTLDDFFFGPAGGGSVPFEWEHPRRHVTVRVRFRESPRYTAAHPEDVWFVALSFEVLPPGMTV